MDATWPWLAVAGLGALHGASPANGWMFAAAWGVHARDAAQARRVLWPIAFGHLVSIAIVVYAVAQGVWMDRALMQGVAGGLLIGLAVYRCLRDLVWPRTRTRIDVRTGHAGIAAWSCLMATTHGAGLMLVPALIPLCMADTPARALTASGSLGIACAAIAIHMSAMLITTGAIATGVCRGVAMHPRVLDHAALRHAWTVALATTGTLLLALQ